MDIYGVLINLVVVALLVVSGFHIGDFVVDIYLAKAQPAVSVASDMGSIFDALYSVPEDLSFTYYLPSSCAFNGKVNNPEYLCDQGKGKITSVGILANSGPGDAPPLIGSPYICEDPESEKCPKAGFVTLAEGYLPPGDYQGIFYNWHEFSENSARICLQVKEGLDEIYCTIGFVDEQNDVNNDPITADITITKGAVYVLRLYRAYRDAIPRTKLPGAYGTSGAFIYPKIKEKDIFYGDDIAQGHGWITVSYAIRDETTGEYVNHTNVFNAFVANKNDVCLIRKQSDGSFSSFYDLTPDSIISLQSDGGIKIEKTRTNFDSLCAATETSASTFKQLLNDINDNFCSPGVDITKTGSSFSWNSELYGIGVMPSVSDYSSNWGLDFEQTSDSISGAGDANNFIAQLQTRDANVLEGDTNGVIALDPLGDLPTCPTGFVKSGKYNFCLVDSRQPHFAQFNDIRFAEWVVLKPDVVNIIEAIKMRWASSKGRILVFYKSEDSNPWKLLFERSSDDSIFKEDLIFVRDTVSHLLIATDRFYTYNQDISKSDNAQPLYIDYIGFNYQVSRNAEDDDKVCLYKVEKYAKEISDTEGILRKTYTPIGTENDLMKEKSFPEHCIDLSEVFKGTACRDLDFNFKIPDVLGYCANEYCRSRNLYYKGDYDSKNAPYFTIEKKAGAIDINFIAPSETQ